ncbi:MAG TPA: histidine kinase [Bacteroidales bacterium]|nr:histidine kinase [Bacteroidales bacterium]HPS17553.1 histidine kinase [Bacteroidales bacterium]
MKKRAIILSHITFWILATVVQILPILTWDNLTEIKDSLIEEFFMTILCMLFFYGSYFYITRILIKKRFFLFLLIFFSSLFLFTLLIMKFYPPLLFMFISPVEDINYTRWFFSLISYIFVFGLWGTMFRITINWFIEKQKEKELEKQNIFSELGMLRSQINPHFLFNTLNNINSFIYREPDKTSFGIAKLTDIMRYMLYDANAEKVKLTDEINYIKNYIDLQKLRIKESDYVHFDIIGNTENVMIPPMLLIPFVENAFKHGRKNMEGVGIFIKLFTDGKKINFEVKNFLLNTTQPFEKNGGFGLKNIRRRLELIYGSEHQLTCNEQNDMFIVTLNIDKI